MTYSSQARTETIVQHTERALLSSTASTRTATVLLRQLSALCRLVAGALMSVSIGGLSEQEDHAGEVAWATTSADDSEGRRMYASAAATQDSGGELPAQVDDAALPQPEPPAIQRRPTSLQHDLRPTVDYGLDPMESRKVESDQRKSSSRTVEAEGDTDALSESAETASPSSSRLRPRLSTVFDVRRTAPSTFDMHSSATTDEHPSASNTEVSGRRRRDRSLITHLRPWSVTTPDESRRGKAMPHSGQPTRHHLSDAGIRADQDTVGAQRVPLQGSRLAPELPHTRSVDDTDRKQTGDSPRGIDRENRNNSDTIGATPALSVRSIRRTQQHAIAAFDKRAVRTMLGAQSSTHSSHPTVLDNESASDGNHAQMLHVRNRLDPRIDDDVSRLAEQLERILRDEARRHGIIL